MAFDWCDGVDLFKTTANQLVKGVKLQPLRFVSVTVGSSMTVGVLKGRKPLTCV